MDEFFFFLCVSGSVVVTRQIVTTINLSKSLADLSLHR